MESELTIRKMLKSDGEIVVDMMRRFYNSPALITNGSEKIFQANVDNCTGGSAFVEGFIFTAKEKIVGYGIIAKSYSTEFGSECVWIEDIFIETEYRGRGFGSKFIQHVKKNYSGKVLRLEAEKTNDKALAFYKNFGFEELPYLELIMRRGD